MSVQQLACYTIEMSLKKLTNVFQNQSNTGEKYGDRIHLWSTPF